MIRFKVEAVGLTEVSAALASLPAEFRAVVAETIDQGSAMIEVDYKAHAPVDEGDLVRSIGRNVRSDGLQAAIGAGEVHAPFVEFGTNDTPAQPALWPAFKRGTRFIRRQIREWAARAGMRVRLRTKRFRRPKAVA